MMAWVLRRAIALFGSETETAIVLTVWSFDLVRGHAHTLVSLLQVLNAQDVRRPLLDQPHALANQIA
jgi:hypothetical protein